MDRAHWRAARAWAEHYELVYGRAPPARERAAFERGFQAAWLALGGPTNA